MRRVFSGENMLPLSAQLISHAEHHPQDANALMDLSTLLLLLGHSEAGLATQREALAMQQTYTVGTGKLRVLALKAAGALMANTPIELLVEHQDVTLTLMYVGPNIPMVANVPEYDVLMTVIGHAEENRHALSVQAASLRHYPKHRQAINHPARIMQLEREAASKLLHGIPGVVMPTTVRVLHHELDLIARRRHWIGSLASEMAWPVIIRPLDSHAGNGLARIDSSDALGVYLDQTEGREFYVAPFVDYRSADGLYRKYRIILVDGRPYICHIGISSHWMVHYLNAGMADSQAKRDEEAEAMAGFDAGFAKRHESALAVIAEHCGLEYLGIDCAETQRGELLIFEADSDMIVHNLDAPDVYPYKAAHMKKLFGAFMGLLERRA